MPLKHWVWLSTRKNLSARGMGELLSALGSPESVYYARPEEYKKVPHIAFGAVKSLQDKDMAEAETIIARCGELRCRIMTMSDADYPDRLKNIYDAPIVLYVKGRMPTVDDEACVAVVGSRTCTGYGLKMAEMIGYEICRGGGVLVTGLAAGIDTAAAKGALRAGGRVIGVLGCGVDVVYPAFNKNLFRDVRQKGVLISEYPPGTRPYGNHFPVRNRIMSGLSVGVTVVEAPARSGALITASRALEQGRDVYAVPGNADSYASRGSNALLKEGAEAVMTGREILENYAQLFPEKLNKKKRSAASSAQNSERVPEKRLSAGTKPLNSTEKEIDNKKGEAYIDVKTVSEPHGGQAARDAAGSTPARRTVDAGEFTAEELAVMRAFGEGATHVDDLIVRSGLPASVVLAALTVLEINGYVSQQAGKRFVTDIVICAK